MQPTPEPAPIAPPVVGESLVEFVRADRQRAGFILLGIAALLLAVCGWAALSARKSAVAEKQPDEAKLQLDEATPKDPHRMQYVVGALLAGLGALSMICVGGWLLVSLPPIQPAGQRVQARAAILATGGLLGAIIMLAGVTYFYFWSSAVFDWLDKGQTKQSRYVVGPLLAVAVGGLLMFLAIQPARAEERKDYVLRRLIYWTNFGLSVLLVFIVLVVTNVIAGEQMPNRLDVTETSFYSLSAGSKELLQKLPEPVTVYGIVPASGREYDDIRRLLQNCRDESGGKFKVVLLSPVSDQAEYRKLAEKYPVLKAHEVEGTTLGVLLTTGPDEKRSSYIRADEFFRTQQPASRNEQGTRLFVGEGRLMRELLFLVESEKAVVYFTQSAGELDIGAAGGQQAEPTTTAHQLKEYLGRNNLDVRPLKFDLKEPKVPADAAVVIVAGPQRPLATAHVEAIRKYLAEPHGGKKGKLIVLAGAEFGPPPKNEVLLTGLEGLLAEYNVQLDQRVVIGIASRDPDPYMATVGVTFSAVQARNPVAMALGTKPQFPSVMWRQVGVARTSPAFRATPLLGTADRDRYTWLENHYLPPRELQQTINDLARNQAVRAAKQFTDDPRMVGVAVSEGQRTEQGSDAGRMVVVGNSLFVSDAVAGRTEPPGFALVSGSVDWLRERPQLGIAVENKKYAEFKFPATTDENRGLFLPLLLSITGVAGLGIGVWMVRRGSA